MDDATNMGDTGDGVSGDADELARLIGGERPRDHGRWLPGLAECIAYVRRSQRSDGQSKIVRLARAAELLAAERATWQAASGTSDPVDVLRATLDSDRLLDERDATIATLAARVAEAERKLADVCVLQRSTAADLDVANAKLRAVSAGPDDVWRWQGDGHDDPASLSCPVVMSADTLRLFVAERARFVALLADANAWWSAHNELATTAKDPGDARYQEGKAHGILHCLTAIEAALSGKGKATAAPTTGHKRCDNCREFGTMVDESGRLVYLWGAGDRKQAATVRWSAQIAETILERQGKAAPTGHAVAGLLERVEEARNKARDGERVMGKGDPDGDTFSCVADAYEDAARMIRDTLTAPSPLDEVVATVLGVDVAATIADGEQGMLEAVDRLNTELFHGTPAGHVVTLRKLGALAIQYLARNTKSPTS